MDGLLCSTPAHQRADFAELVCSNSLKSESESTAPWLVKREMRCAGCALLACATRARARRPRLAVDRVDSPAGGRAGRKAASPYAAERSRLDPERLPS